MPLPWHPSQINEEQASVVVIISGQRFKNFLSLNLKRSKEEACGSGTVVLSWPGTEQFEAAGPVASAFGTGTDGTIMIDGQIAARVRFDTRISKGTPKSYELTLQFRGICSAAVDGSPNHETGQENQKTPAQIIRTLLQGYGIELEDRSGGGKTIERFIIAEGETVERAARRAAREMGLTLYEGRMGQWILEKQSSGGSGGKLQLGRHFTHWSVKQDIVPRFTEIGVAGNGIPTDDRYGKQNESLYDKGMRELMNFEGLRHLRVLIDGDHTQESLKQRGETEGNRRQGQGLNVTLRVSTHSDENGMLWDLGQKYHVTIPIDGVDEELELSEVEFEITPTSRTATLVLMGKGAFGGANVPGNYGTAEQERNRTRMNDAVKQPPPPEQTPTEPETPPPPAPQEGLPEQAPQQQLQPGEGGFRGRGATGSW